MQGGDRHGGQVGARSRARTAWRRPGGRAAEAGPVRRRPGAEQVDLVPDEDAGDLLRAQGLQRRLHREPLVPPVRMAGVDHLEEEVRGGHLLQGGPEGRHQVRGQVVDEPHGVGEQGPPVPWEGQQARGRVQGGEEGVLHVRVRAREGAVEGALARVRVPDQGHPREVGRPAAPLHRPRGPQVLQLMAQRGDARPDPPAVRLELGLPGPTGADAAAGAAHLLDERAQARQQVQALRELDLHPPLAALRAAGEDVEDQPGAVHDLGVQRDLQVPLVRRGEVAVAEDRACAVRLEGLTDLLDLAAREERRGIGAAPGLQDGGHDLRVRGPCELRELRHVVRQGPSPGHVQAREHGLLAQPDFLPARRPPPRRSFPPRGTPSCRRGARSPEDGRGGSGGPPTAAVGAAGTRSPPRLRTPG